MSTLEAAVNSRNSYPYGLCWAVKDGSRPNERVIELIRNHRAMNMASGLLLSILLTRSCTTYTPYAVEEMR